MERKTGSLKFGLRLKFIALILGGIFVFSVIYGWYYLGQTKRILVEELQRRGIALTKNLSYNAKFGVLAEDRALLEQLIDGFYEDVGVAYVVIVNKEGHILSQRFKEAYLERELPKILRITTSPLKPTPIDSISGSNLYDIFDEVVTAGEERGQRGSGDMLDLDVAGRGETSPDLGSSRGNEGIIAQGFVHIGISERDVDNKFASMRWVAVLLVLISYAIATALAIYFVNFIVSPVTNMVFKAKLISEGDLTQRVEVTSTDELGILAEAFNRMGANLNEMFQRVRGAAVSVAGIAKEIADRSKMVLDGSGYQTSAVRDTSSYIEQTKNAIKGIAENTEILSSSAQESSSSILEMGASIEEVSENMEVLSASVEETASSIGEMAVSIKQVAGNVESLLNTTHVTARSMVEIDGNIKQVESNVSETSNLSAHVEENSRAGVKVVQETIEEMSKIESSMQEVNKAMGSLWDRVKEIGNILGVIDEVAEQTNLLALNAAIIAAQAGEHGKGFAVVADEIKELAERTGSSTREISQIIKSVQVEAQRVITAGKAVDAVVEEGVERSKQAGDALKKISESAGRSLERIQEIASATAEQAKGSKQITEAISRIADMVSEMSKATAEQSKGGEQIMRASERMRETSRQVKSSVQEQAKGSKLITQSIENITMMVNYINKATQEQSDFVSTVVKAFEKIGATSQKNVESASVLNTVVDALSKQAQILNEVVGKFKV